MSRKINIVLLLLFLSCKQKEIKIVVSTYDHGQPMTVYYFETANDFAQSPKDTTIGELIAVDKPVNMKQEQFYENGKKVNEGRYEQGFATGLWRFYYPDGTLQARGYYKNGHSTDTVYCYYESGKLKRLLVETDKHRSYWHSVDYYENGSKLLECFTYTDSLGNSYFDGPLKQWHANGQLKEEATLKMGKSVGVWRNWDTNGLLIKTSEEVFPFGYK